MLFLAQQQTQQSGSGILQMIIFAALIFGVMYFLILRPQKKREQERKDMLGKLQKGDRIMTIGGIYGEAVSVKEDYVIILVDKERGTTLKVSRTAINSVITTDSPEQEQK